jgi:hypothetical protein
MREKPAGAEAGDADAKARAAESGVLHLRIFYFEGAFKPLLEQIRFGPAMEAHRRTP